MNSQVTLFGPLGLLLLTHVCLMLVVNEVDDGQPRITVVDVVTESRCVNHGELNLELLLLKLGLDDIDFSELVELLVVTPGVAFSGRQLS
jgi:hypothetical protein